MDKNTIPQKKIVIKKSQNCTCICMRKYLNLNKTNQLNLRMRYNETEAEKADNSIREFCKN